MSRKVAAPDIDGEQGRDSGAHRVTHIRRMIDDPAGWLSAPGPIPPPPVAVERQRAVDLDGGMLVQRVKSSRPEEEHANCEPWAEGKRRRPAGGAGDDRVPVVLEERGAGRLTPVVGILRPRQRRTEGPKRRAERLRSTARSRIEGAVPESTDGKTLERDIPVWPVAHRIDRPGEPGESIDGGGGTLILRARSRVDQSFAEGAQEPPQQSPALGWIRMRYALAHA